MGKLFRGIPLYLGKHTEFSRVLQKYGSSRKAGGLWPPALFSAHGSDTPKKAAGRGRNGEKPKKYREGIARGGDFW